MITPTNNALPELRPCPFCGGTNIRTEHDEMIPTGGYDYMAVCGDCGGSSDYFKSREETAIAWNRRAEPSSNPLQFGRASAGREAVDKGPWHWKRSGSKVDVFSDDFAHDVALRIDGDFASDADADAYASWLTDALNNAHPTAPELPKQGEGGMGSVGAEDDAWKVGMFDRWNAYAQQLGYTGMCDALFNIPELRALAKKAEGA